MMMVPAAVMLMMKKGISWLPGPCSPENTAHMSPPKKGPRARTPLARLCAVPFTAPLADGGANLFTIACAVAPTQLSTGCQRSASGHAERLSHRCMLSGEMMIPQKWDGMGGTLRHACATPPPDQEVPLPPARAYIKTSLLKTWSIMRVEPRTMLVGKQSCWTQALSTRMTVSAASMPRMPTLPCAR